MPFKVKTSSFEGPLDLLLELIEKKKLHINDISLAKVADDFIEHTKQYENIPMAESAQFILIASTLLLIKSKSLLPGLSLSEDEKSDIKDLERRLIIYQRIKEASQNVAHLFGTNPIYFQSQSKAIEPVFAPDSQFNLNLALELIRDLIKRLPKKESLPKTMVMKVISLEEMIDTLSKRITSHLKISFSEFTKDHRTNRVNVIISFLAMLELVKQGIVLVSQDKNFADIEMETKEVGVPHY
jgi:segregation and condensation protein A